MILAYPHLVIYNVLFKTHYASIPGDFELISNLISSNFEGSATKGATTWIFLWAINTS